MKYKGIFGVVLALHIGMGLFIVTQPGCQSTQQSESMPPESPIIGAVAENEVDTMAAEPVAPIPEPAEDDLFRPLDSSFNTGAPEPVFVGAANNTQPNDYSPASRSAPLRPEEPATPQIVGVLDYTPPPAEPVKDEESMTIVADEPVSKTYTVSPGDSLWAISKDFSVSIDSIREANSLTSNVLKVGQILIIPGSSRELSVSAPPRESRSPSVSQDIEGKEYVVMPRDTLSGIAQKTGVSVKDIRSLNNLKGDLIRVGDVLVLPASVDMPMVDTPQESAPAEPATSGVTPVSGVYHVVESGENPTIIARKYGLSVKELMQKNGNFDPRSLKVGQRLLVGDVNVSQDVEVMTAEPQPVVPQFEPVSTENQGGVSVEIPSEPAFDEEAFMREIEDAPIVSPVPVE